MYDIKEIYQPSSLFEALEIMAGNQDGIIISGGTDVLIRMRERKIKECKLISIHRLKELQGISYHDTNGDITIFPGTCFEEIHNSTVMEKHCHCLWQAAEEVGSPQIRTVATIGGNVCNGAVSADSAPSLLVLEAELELTNTKYADIMDVSLPHHHGPDQLHSRRVVSVKDFYVGPGKTVLDQGNELLTAIRIPAVPENSGSFYIKYGKRNALEISTLGCGAYVALDRGKRKILELRISFGVAAPVPIRCPVAEELAAGRPLTRETVDLIGEQVLSEVNPRDSWRASRQLRLQLVRELSRRALVGAVENAGGVIID